MDIFSFSRLSLYHQCPLRFYYKYVLGKEEPVTKSLALGKAVHKAIEFIIKGIDFDEAIKQGLIECDFHEEVFPDEIRDLVRNAPFQNLKGETEVHFCLPLFNGQETPKLQGYIDLVDGDRIYDFKTNRIVYDIMDNFQVALYAWALSQITGAKQIQGSLLFLRYRKESTFIFDETVMNNAAQWARDLVNEIRFNLEALEFYPEKLNELFPYKPSSYCKHCPFALDCHFQNQFTF